MGKLYNLETIDLSNNKFSGQILSEMGELVELTNLGNQQLHYTEKVGFEQKQFFWVNSSRNGKQSP